MKYIILICAVLLCAPQVNATVLPYKNLNDLVEESDGIIVGTVRNVESHLDPSKDIYTFVKLDQLEVLHGNYHQRTLTLRLMGGQVQNDILHVEGSPEFSQNDRVILFVRNNGSEIVPLVGWTQGVLRIVRDPATGREVINDHDGNRVVGVRDGHIEKHVTHQSDARIIPNRPEGNLIPDRQQGPISEKSTLSEAFAGNTDDGSAAGLIEQSDMPNLETLSAATFMETIRRTMPSRAQHGRSITSVGVTDLSSKEDLKDKALVDNEMSTQAAGPETDGTEPFLPRPAPSEQNSQDSQ